MARQRLESYNGGGRADSNVVDDYLYDIGLFTSAGAKPSWSVARWSDSPAAAPEPILGAARGGIQLAARPNPLREREQATFRYELTQAGIVRLAVFDVKGARVATLIDGEVQREGEHAIRWDGSTDAGSAAAAGVYYVYLVTPRQRGMARIVLIP